MCMRKLDYENKPSTAAESGEDSGFYEVGDAVKARPAEFVRALGERLYLIGTSVQLFSDPHARADLLAIDPEGTAVVVVTEREGEHSLLERGLMCAGLVAGWKPEFFFRYPTAGPAAKLRAFLQIPDEQVNRAQRVVLVAHSHDFAVFSAAQWLAQQHGIEIQCVQGRLEPESGRLDLVRLEAESFQPGEPVETVRVVLPRLSDDAEATGPAQGVGQPLEPALVPLIGSTTGACRLRTIWRPASETASPAPEAAAGPPVGVSEPSHATAEDLPAPQVAESIEQLADQILEEEPVADATEAADGDAGSRQPAENVEAEIYPVGAGPVAAEQGANGEPAETPASESEPSEASQPTPEPVVERRRPFRIVGLTVVIVALAAAGLFVLSIPSPPPPAAITTEATIEQAPPPPPPATPAVFRGAVLDRVTGRPIPGARVYYAGRSSRAAENGEFELEITEEQSRLLVKAPGYRQTESTIAEAGPIRLTPLEVRGYYVSPSHSSDPSRRETILNLIRGTEANAVVLGVKDVTGRIHVPIDHPLAGEIQAADRAGDVALARQVARWKAEGIYTIGLITLFKDNLLARKKTGLALRSLESQKPIIDADGVAWADPGQAPVRDYNLAVAKAAAEAGFDEIHFDFIRYPSEGLSREGGSRKEYDRRLETLVVFLRDANEMLAPYNVYLSVSVFGSVCVMPRASVIGQKIEEFAEYADYVSPMLYPSYFEPGKKFPIPLRHAYQLVHESLLRATHRLQGQNLKLRPWLQNFPDRASPNEPLHAHSIFGQVKAAEDARASGWMLWDARSVYRNTAEAMTMLNGDRESTRRPDADSSGGSAVPFPDTGGSPPPGSLGERFRLVAVLFLAGCCLAVLYGGIRAAWLFREWSRTGPAAPPASQHVAASNPSTWLARPQFLRGLPHARPR